jgi:GGDEF domain-containing protein
MKIEIPDDVYQSLEEYRVSAHTTMEQLFPEIINLLQVYDPLTLAFNRYAFYEDMMIFETRLKEATLPITLKILAVNISQIREYNNLHGHPAGDALLQSVVKDLWAKYPNSRVYRMGGDTFYLRLDSIVEKLPEFHLDQSLWLTLVSIEIKELSEEAISHYIVETIDKSMYYSKKDNKFRWKYRYPEYQELD